MKSVWKLLTKENVQFYIGMTNLNFKTNSKDNIVDSKYNNNKQTKTTALVRL